MIYGSIPTANHVDTLSKLTVKEMPGLDNIKQQQQQQQHPNLLQLSS